MTVVQVGECGGWVGGVRIANERVAISLAYLARLSHSSPTSTILDIRVSRYSTRININRTRTDRHLLAALSGGAGEEGGGNAGKTERVRLGGDKPSL